MSTTVANSDSWTRSLAEAIRDPVELLRAVGVDSAGEDLPPNDAGFPTFAPRSYVARMQFGIAEDPLLRQVLPVADEEAVAPGFVPDAVDDQAARVVPGLLHKYEGRALLITTGACAVHCRYCFRRHYPYGEEPRTLDAWQPALEAIAEDRSIAEVILSGGDPLMLRDARLAELVDRLAAIPHVRRLRVHTRLPIVLPDRVTEGLLRVFREARPTTVFVVHANHANELVGDCAEALGALVAAVPATLNQAVLLRGVNDTVAAQEALGERLIELGVVPYYLHQLDRVAGTAHFEVPVAEGLRIVEELRRTQPGYLVPRYVREVAGEPFKMPIG